MFEKQKRITNIGDTQTDALATAALQLIREDQQKYPGHPILDCKWDCYCCWQKKPLCCQVLFLETPATRCLETKHLLFSRIWETQVVRENTCNKMLGLSRHLLAGASSRAPGKQLPFQAPGSRFSLDCFQGFVRSNAGSLLLTHLHGVRQCYLVLTWFARNDSNPLDDVLFPVIDTLGYTQMRCRGAG